MRAIKVIRCYEQNNKVLSFINAYSTSFLLSPQPVFTIFRFFAP